MENDVKKREINWDKWGVIISLLSFVIALFGIQFSCNIFQCSENENEITSPTDVYIDSPAFPQLENLSVGDHFFFGSYEQDNDLSNGAEPIEWRVLDITSDGSALVISEYGLDCVPYNETFANVTWGTCTLRNWLNDEFFDCAFSTAEQQRILKVTLSNPDNATYGSIGGADTSDSIFCLSIDEVEYYFYGESERKCQPTIYAESMGAYIYYGNCWWWRRSPGDGNTNAASIFGDAPTYTNGSHVDNTKV